MALRKKTAKNKKSKDSILDYLLTYGWALIILAVAIALLFVLFDSQITKTFCKIEGKGLSLESFYISSSKADFVLSNETGAIIYNLKIIGHSDDFTGVWHGVETIQPLNTAILTGLKPTKEYLNNSHIDLSFIANGKQQNVSIVCYGKVD